MAGVNSVKTAMVRQLEDGEDVRCDVQENEACPSLNAAANFLPGRQRPLFKNQFNSKYFMRK